MSEIPDTWELRKESSLGTLPLGMCLCVMQTTRHGMYVEVRRQPDVHHVGPGDQTPVLRLGGKCLDPLSHLSIPYNRDLTRGQHEL